MIKGLTTLQHWDAGIETWREIVKKGGDIDKSCTALCKKHNPIHGCFLCELFSADVDLENLCIGCPFRKIGKDSPLACEYAGSPYQEWREARLRKFKPATIKKYANKVLKLLIKHYPGE